MPTVQADFKDAVKRFENLPDGEYSCVITDCVQKQSKTSGNHYLSWTFTVMNSEKFNGRKLFCNTTYFGKGAGILQNLWESTFGRSHPGGDLDTDDLLTNRVICVVGHEPSINGKGDRNVILSFKADPEATNKPNKPASDQFSDDLPF